MAQLLTSWKEIAQYVGKGVRTVQRWEQRLEFPVRRPDHCNYRRVIAMPEELDAWLRSWQKQKNGKRVEEVHLRQQVLELQEQVNHLRTQLQAYQRAEQQRTIETSCAVKNSFDNSTQRILS